MTAPAPALTPMSNTRASPRAGALKRATAVAALAAAAGAAPAYTAELLSASGPVWVTAGAFATLSALLLAAEVTRRRAVRVVAVLAFGTAVLAVLIQIVIVPFGAYVVWLDLAAAGRAQGAVSFVFVLLIGLGGVIATALVPRERLQHSSRANLSAGILIGALTFVAWSVFVAGVAYERRELVFAAAGTAVFAVSLHAAICAVNAGAKPAQVLGSGAQAVAVLGLAFALAAPVSLTREPRGSRLVDDYLSPRLRHAVLQVWPKLALIAEVPGYGEALDSRRLTGRPLLSEAPVFDVWQRSGSAVYLRSAIYELYDGQTWERSEHTRDHRAGGPLKPVPRITGASTATPVMVRDPRGSSGQPDLRVRVRSDFLTWVPHTLDTRAVRIIEQRGSDSDDARVPIEGNLDSGIRPQQALVAEDEVELWTEPDRAHYENQFERVLPLNAQRVNNAGLRKERRHAYLQLPDDLPDAVHQHATALRVRDDAATVAAIRADLTGEGTYTLNPPRPPGGADVVQAFLEAGRVGYCVQFATAAVVLARAAGIPARYVIGHIVPPGERKEYRTVSGLRAHAWAEVFVDGRWQTLEATPAVGVAVAGGSVAELEAAGIRIGNDSLTRRQLEELGFPLPRRKRMPSLPQIVLPPPLPTVVGLALVLAGCGLVPFIRRTCAPPPVRVRRVLARLAAGASPQAHPRWVGWSGWERSMVTGVTAGATPPRHRIRPAHLRRAREIAHRFAFHASVPGGANRFAVAKRELRFLRKLARRTRRLRKSVDSIP